MYFHDLDPQCFDSSHNGHFFIHLQPDSPIQDFTQLNLNSRETQIKRQPVSNIFYQESLPQEASSSQEPDSSHQQVHKSSGKDQIRGWGKKGKAVKKNQYDKNIFSNITTVIVKRMLSTDSHPILKLYCQYKQLCLITFLSYFKQMQRSKMRLGTTQIAKFYSNPQISTPLKEVFGMYLIYFLREEYIRYILREGKMSDKQKYLRCATKMMYIPKLSLKDYTFLNSQCQL